MDLAIVRCAVPVPIAPTRLSVLPLPRHYQPAILFGYSSGQNLDPELVHTFLSGTVAMHVKFSHLVPSIQYPRAPTSAGDTYTSILLNSSSASGFLNTPPEGGMSGGAVVDMQCGLLGVVESRSLYGDGGSYIRLIPRIVQQIMAALKP
jgi:hypothetical protein